MVASLLEVKFLQPSIASLQLLCGGLASPRTVVNMQFAKGGGSWLCN